MSKISVLVVGLEPAILDFSDPTFKNFPGVTADKVREGLEHDIATLRGHGYDAEFLGTDYGATAGAVLAGTLDAKAYDCIVIGAGVRLFPRNTPLLETLVDTIRTHAPAAKIGFNTSPADTADAVARWFPRAA